MNTATLLRTRRSVDDFTTGPDSFTVDSETTVTRTQSGSMLGGTRRIRLPNASRTNTASVDVSDQGLRLVLGAGHTASLEIVYGARADQPGAPGLGANLQEDADRLRLEISQLTGTGVIISVGIFTPRRWRGAEAFVGVGPVEFLFADMGATESQDLTEVNHLEFRFRVIGSQPERDPRAADVDDRSNRSPKRGRPLSTIRSSPSARRLERIPEPVQER